jgi:hypothetical protein
MVSRLFVVAGPQASGKTTTKEYLACRYAVLSGGAGDESPRNLTVLQEMRQIVMQERGIRSAIFIDSRAECEIIERDLRRMRGLLDSNLTGDIFLDETNAFTLAHAACHGLDISDYLMQYQDLLRDLDATVLFLDVPPDISWLRRQSVYQARVATFPVDQAKDVLVQHRRYLDTAYDCLCNLVQSLPVEVRKVDAAGPIQTTLQASAQAFLASRGSYTFCQRF